MQNDNVGYGAGDIHGAAWHASIIQKQLDEDRAKALAATTDSVRILMNSHHNAAAAIKNNPEYTEAGKQSRLAALVQQSDARLATRTQATIDDLKATTIRLSRSIANAAVKTLDVPGMLRAIEIRTIASGMDKLDLEMQCKQLAQFGGDDASVMAVLGASALQELLRPEVAADIGSMMGARILPDEAEALRQARDSLAILENAVGTAAHGFATGPERITYGIGDNPVDLSGRHISVDPRTAPGA